MVNPKVMRKHPPVKILSRKQIKTTIYVKSVTPYVSALKRIKKFLRDLDINASSYVVVLGMGKAVDKVLSLGCYFEQQMGKKVDVLTKSVDVVDEILTNDQEENEDEEPERDIDRETTLRKRTVSGVELRIHP